MIFIESCSGQGAVRLNGGQNERVGRVEFCYGGEWGTVCDDLWSTPDAQVVCRQLGYSTIGGCIMYMCYICYPICHCSVAGVIARKTAYYGQGAGPIQLDNVACAGTEQNLIDCPHITNHNCAHSKDAGVDCPGKQTAVKCLF